MEQAGAIRLYERRHRDRPYHDGTFPEELSGWAKEPSRAHPFHFMDGVVITIAERDLNPDDHFLGKPEPTDEEG